MFETMKKLVLSFILGIGFGVYSYAASKQVTTIQEPQKKESSKKKKVERYDFSLFKFVTPSFNKSKTDSLTAPIHKKERSNLKDDTTYLFSNRYEKPLRSLMRS